MDAWISLVIGLVGGGGIASIILAWQAAKKTKPEIRVLQSQENENIADAAKISVETLLQSLEFMRKERAEYLPRMDALEAQQDENKKTIRDLQNGRDERTKQIEELQKHNENLQAGIIDTQAQVEKLNRDYVQETTALHAEIDNLRKQVAEGDAKYKVLKDYTVSVLTAIKENKTLPEVPPELGDSIRGLKWPQDKKP